jgi:L-alanine-DL-glutamate epimerase-like enolase superfamily enzyme
VNARIISDLAAWPVDIPLRDVFTISSGSLTCVENIFLRVTLADGSSGFGESAPFPGVTGETRAGTLAAIDSLRRTVIGQSAENWITMAVSMREASPEAPAARCGIETAILDALCRSLGVPLWQYLGGADRSPYETDITIPISGYERSLELAENWYVRGFRIFKLKVGLDLDTDLRIIDALARRHFDASFVLDANEGFDEPSATALIAWLTAHEINVRLIEQPLKRTGLDAMARLRRTSKFCLAADESVMSFDQAKRVIEAHAADVINIKIMKLGVAEAMRIIAMARAAGIGLMYGGMVETRLAMGCSLCLASTGDVHSLDLDTPLLMTEDPVTGGCRYDGPRMHMTTDAGHGARPSTADNL